MSLTAPPAPRVLVTDDEDNIRFLLDAALRHFGFDVVLAANGREALGAVADEKPDLIVLDVMLPDLDGFEVCRRLRADGIRVPVLFLTARDGTEEKVRGLTLGGDDYVTKPFSLEEVVARVRAILPPGERRGADAPCCASPTSRWTRTRMSCGARGVSVDLSPTEYKLLRYLLINAGRVVTQGADPGSCVGVRLRWRGHRRGDLRELPAQEARSSR